MPSFSCVAMRASTGALCHLCMHGQARSVTRACIDRRARRCLTWYRMNVGVPERPVAFMPLTIWCTLAQHSCRQGAADTRCTHKPSSRADNWGLAEPLPVYTLLAEHMAQCL